MIDRRDFLKLLGGTTALTVATGCQGLGEGASQASPAKVASFKDSVDHIIFTMQENRSFDHYFGKLPEYRAQRRVSGQVDGLPPNASNPSYDGTSTVRPYHLSTQCHENLSPSWNETHVQYNRNNPESGPATLDGFVFAAGHYSRTNDEEPHFDMEGARAMGFYDWRDIPYYYELATQFAISDRMFASVPAATLANRMFLLAATSQGRVYPHLPEPEQMNAKTIFDLLEEAGVSWRIYVNGGFSYYQWFLGANKHLGTNRFATAEQFFADVSSGNLPKVAMIESGTDSGLDEHPRNNIQTGSRYISRFFNALMASPAWQRSVMFLTYDESGGFYDHVAPPAALPPDTHEPALFEEDCPGRFDRYGFRVPFIAVSPFARRHYVSHTVADHTSIMRFIQRRFDLPSLTRRDAQAHDLLDMFNFNSPSFLTPPQMPEQPVSGACDFQLVHP